MDLTTFKGIRNVIELAGVRAAGPARADGRAMTEGDGHAADRFERRLCPNRGNTHSATGKPPIRSVIAAPLAGLALEREEAKR